jgi:hypothetical protein
MFDFYYEIYRCEVANHKKNCQAAEKEQQKNSGERMHDDGRGLITCVMTMTYFGIGCLMTHRLQTFGTMDDLFDLTHSQSIVSKKRKTATLSKIPSIIFDPSGACATTTLSTTKTSDESQKIF